jgi:hypothetical protein
VAPVRKIVAVGFAPLVLVALAGPAGAHGATTNPISRAAACGPEGGQRARSTACQAARAVSDAKALRDWDNLRVPNVNGRDRQKIPDGKLCSGGLAAYRGLDLPRRDWPATKLFSGARFAFSYGTTIPHRGVFKLYITKNGFDPTRRLKWSDLESRPFAAVTDPPLRSGAYVIKGRLPRGKSGRHMIFTIWQNTSTPDTYYSCSDVVFGARKGGVGVGAKPSRKGAGSGKASPSASAPGGADEGAGDQGTGQGGGAGDTEINAANRSSHSLLPLATGGGATALALAAGAAFLLIRRGRTRRPHPAQVHPGRSQPARSQPGPGFGERNFADNDEENW